MDVLLAVRDHGDGLERAGVVRCVDSAEQDVTFVFPETVEPETVCARGGDVVFHEELREVGIHGTRNFVHGIPDT